jgi:CheY-like chemotaxis protein
MPAMEQPVMILVVEDDPGDQLLIEEAFTQSGGDQGGEHELVLVADGEQALDFVRRRGQFADARRPDLILLDLNLPRYDGRADCTEKDKIR